MRFLADRLPAGRVGAVLAERAEGKGLLLPGLDAAAGAPATSRIPGLPRYTFTSSAPPPRTFTDSSRNGGSRR